MQINSFHFKNEANVRKDRVVKYIVVYGQIKVADQKYCHNQISFRTRGF